MCRVGCDWLTDSGRDSWVHDGKDDRMTGPGVNTIDGSNRMRKLKPIRRVRYHGTIADSFGPVAETCTLVQAR